MLDQNEKILPKCMNIGCDKKVVIRSTFKTGNRSIKPFCHRCGWIYSQGLPFPQTITPIKKSYCENKDGRLGFPCGIGFGFLENYSITKSNNFLLHLDHINGNKYDNRPENGQTLCMVCHSIKGTKNNDFDSTKRTN